MRTPLFLVLAILLCTNSAAAQTSLQLRWELLRDTTGPNAAGSWAQFTLTNRDTKPLPKTGWAIYFNALHSALLDSSAALLFQDVMADLHRLVPGPTFTGLAPGASVKIPYLTDVLLNRSFAPAGPYIVFDSAKDVGVPLNDYVAAPFERTMGVVTPDIQYARDSLARDIAVNDLPPVFPTPLQVTRGPGELRLTALPPIAAPPIGSLARPLASRRSAG
ncbi:MAG TPA: carbohydate-binding domain-containing protein, partial [Gemmatimonadales bacterium]|nr:carbohydate-binding domain-containing protein [Gemmatimonadales bacterium]